MSIFTRSLGRLLRGGFSILLYVLSSRTVRNWLAKKIKGGGKKPVGTIVDAPGKIVK